LANGLFWSSQVEQALIENVMLGYNEIYFVLIGGKQVAGDLTKPVINPAREGCRAISARLAQAAG
jgi:hypothetical protein